MTIEEAVIKYLMDRGLDEDRADRIFQRIISDPATTEMEFLWNDPIDDYPNLFDVLSATINRIALAWADEHSSLIDRSLFRQQGKE